MPIIGLSDRGLAFPEIGHVRKGDKVERKRKDGSKYTVPIDLDYFRVEFDEKEQESAEEFRKRYGDKPQEINIILPFDEIERCWDPFLEAYTAGRMVARSNGEKFTYWIDTKTGEIKVKNGEPHTPYTEGQEVGKDYQNKPVHCSPVGRLKVIIPELARAAYLTVHTTSKHDIANISKQLRAFKWINGGVIKGIPLVLRRRPKDISVPKKDGQRVRMEKWMLSIEADPAWVKAKLVEVKHLALPGNGLALLTGEDNGDKEVVQEQIINGEYDYGEDAEEAEFVEEPQNNGKESPETSVEVIGAEPAIKRPYPPEVIRDRIGEFAKTEFPNARGSDKMRSLLRYGLELCFAGEDEIDDKRHTVLMYLAGTESTKDVDAPTMKAILDKWLDIQKDNDTGDYLVNVDAINEAHAIFTAALAGEGQSSLGF